MQYRYICRVGVRPRGAIGIYTDVDFPVVLPTATATVGALFDQWQRLVGDEFQPDVMTHVNGQPTVGVGDAPFNGEEV